MSPMSPMTSLSSLSRSARRGLVTALAAGLLAACAPKAPAGVEQAVLDEAIATAIGDPTTCVLVAERDSGKVVYRYNSHVSCGRGYPVCRGAGARSTDELLKASLTGETVMASCPTTADGSRSVGWAAGPVGEGGEGRTKYVYAAVMEGEKAVPGRVMAARLSKAFRKAGLIAPEPTSP